MTFPAPVHVAARALHAARAWSVSSQRGACRNARAEATACARQRAEREAIDAYVRAEARPRRAPEQREQRVRRAGG